MADKTKKQDLSEEQLQKKLDMLPTLIGKMDSEIEEEALAFTRGVRKAFGEINDLQKELTGEDPGLGFRRLYELADRSADAEEVEELKVQVEQLQTANQSFAATEKLYQAKIESLDILVNKKKIRERERQEKREAREQRRLERQAKKANSAGTSDDDESLISRKTWIISGRIAGALGVCHIVGETINYGKVEAGYVLDSLGGVATAPGMLIAGAVCGGITMGAIGKVIDFCSNGFKAFDFRDAIEAWNSESNGKLKRDYPHHYNSTWGVFVGSMIGGFFGLAGGLATGILTNREIHKWRHDLHENKQTIIKTTKATAFNQTLEDAVASNPNTVAYPIAALQP